MTEKKSVISQLPVVLEMAEKYHLTGPSLVHTVRTVAVDGKISDTELLSCLMVAKEHDLNPLTREIFFIKGKAKKDKATGQWVQGLVQPIVSVDGWIKKCNTNPQFNGLEFEDIHDDKGNLRAITCKIWRKDREHPTTITEYMDECRPKDVSFGPWASHPSRMLRHRALIQCARIAFGFAGLMDPDEYKVWQDAIDVTPEPEFIDIEEALDEEEVQVDEAEIIDLDQDTEDGLQVGDQFVSVDGVISEIEQEMALCQDIESLNDVLDQWDDVIQRMPDRKSHGVEAAFEAAKQRILEGEAA